MTNPCTFVIAVPTLQAVRLIGHFNPFIESNRSVFILGFVAYQFTADTVFFFAVFCSAPDDCDLLQCIQREPYITFGTSKRCSARFTVTGSNNRYVRCRVCSFDSIYSI